MGSAATLVAIALTASVPAPRPQMVPAIRCGGYEDVSDVLARQSIAILVAALSNDPSRLAGAVGPQAQSLAFTYDNGMEAREAGPAGVVELIRQIGPVRYQYLKLRGLPPPRRDPCIDASVSLTLLDRRDAAYEVNFTYKDGVLTQLRTQDADFMAGNLSKLRQ